MSTTYLADKTDDARFSSPEQILQRCIDEDLGKRGAFERGKKLLVLSLDDTEGRYEVSFRQAGMYMSECITITRLAEIEFMKEMGYIPE